MRFKEDGWGLYLHLDTGMSFGPLSDEADGIRQMNEYFAACIHEYFAVRIKELDERVARLETKEEVE